MFKKMQAILAAMLMAVVLIGCGAQPSDKASESTKNESQSQKDTQEESQNDSQQVALFEDGIYSAKFSTDSSMFHVNEANKGLGTLTVENGKMTLHVSLAGTGIVNLYVGLAEKAQKDSENVLNPTTDTVTYEDGTTEEVFGFDIPVTVVDEEFDVAIFGKKGKWYDHKVSVSEVTKKEASAVADGEYTVNLEMEGGSGKASITSPVIVTVKEGKAYAKLVWSSKNYDYMIVGGQKYMNEANEGEPSVFTVLIDGLNCDMEVIGDTVAMSTPHEIEYTLHFKFEE